MVIYVAQKNRVAATRRKLCVISRPFHNNDVLALAFRGFRSEILQFFRVDFSRIDTARRPNLFRSFEAVGSVTCADVRTGEVHWRERVPGSYYASPVCVGGRLYNVSRAGDVVVLAASRRYEFLARNRLDEGSHSTPAVAGGRLYLRTFSHLISLGGR